MTSGKRLTYDNKKSWPGSDEQLESNFRLILKEFFKG